MKRKFIRGLLLAGCCMAVQTGKTQMNYTNLEWVDRSPIVGDSIFHSSTIVVSGKTFVTTNKVNGSGNTDIFTLKIDTNGDTLWSTVKNGTAAGSMDYGVELVNDASGNIYVVGAIQNASTGYDYCVIKYYGTTGAQAWSYVWNGAGNGEDIPSKIIIDGVGGALYVSGGSEASNGFSDFGIIRVSGSGTLVWSQYYDYNHLHDGSTTLTFSGTSYVIASGGSAAAVGDWDLASVKLVKTTGAVNTTTRTNIAGATMVEANAMTTDDLNNVYVTGYSVVSGKKNILTHKLDSNLNLVWSKDYMANYNAVGNDIGVDNSGNVYVTGYDEIQNGGTNFITLKYNSSSTEQWNRQIGNSGDEEYAEAERMAVESDGDVYLTGTSTIANQSKMLFVKYNTDGDTKLVREYESDTVDYEAYDINLYGNDVYITGLEKTVNMTRMNVLKYSLSERQMNAVLDTNDVPLYVEDELIIRFWPDSVISEIVDQKETTYGLLRDFVKPGVIDLMETKYPAVDWLNVRTYKMFKRMTTADSLSITRTGDTIPVPTHWATFVIQVPGENEQVIVDSLHRTIFPYIQYAQLNGIYQPASDDPLYSNQNSLYPNDYPNGDINILPAWTIETGKSNIKVGIYDTGIKWSHEDLGGTFGLPHSKVRGGWDFAIDNSLSFSPNNGDNDALGHGTKVAGIVGALKDNTTGIAGIAGGYWPYGNSVETPTYPETENRGVSLYGYNVLGSGVSESEVVPALIEGSLNTTSGYGDALHIINCSWNRTTPFGGETMADQNAFSDAQRTVFRNGTSMIVAKGDTGDDEIYFPSYAKREYWVLSVGGSDTSGTLHANSSYGGDVDVVAPYSFSAIYSTGNTSNTSYGTFSGTSASAPHVTGLAGLMYSHINDVPGTVNDLAPDDIEFMVQRYADDITTGGAAVGPDDLTGYGLIDAGTTMEYTDRSQYVIKHIKEEIPLVLLGETVLGDFYFGNEEMPYGYYYGYVYSVDVSVNHTLNPGDVILNYWPLNSYSTLLDFHHTIYTPSPQLEVVNEMGLTIPSMSNTQALLVGDVVHLLEDSSGNPIDYWYPAEPGDMIRVGYSLHIQTNYAGTEEAVTNPFLLTCYPNPTNSQLTVQFVLPETSDVFVEILDMQGRTVTNTSAKSLAVGQHSLPFDLSSFTNGVYIVRLKVNDEYHYEKFIKE